jgi:hypothetical protein
MAVDKTNQATLSEKRPSLEKEGDINIIEEAQTSNERLWIQEYDLLRDKTKEELVALNKKVVKKLDWRFLTTITAMLLMKSVYHGILYISKLTFLAVTLIESMSPMLVLLVCRKISA